MSENGVRSIWVTGGTGGAEAISPTLAPPYRGQFPCASVIEREARRRPSGEDRKGELRIPRSRPANDRRRGLRRAHARAYRARDRTPGPRHTGIADPAGRCAGLHAIRAGAARRADAVAVERLRRGGVARLRPARAEA